MKFKKKYDYVIFDFDGVILESNQTKINAFNKTITKETISNKEKFDIYIRKNPEKTRREKFEYYFKKIKKSKFYKNELQKMLDKFSLLLKNELSKCKLIDGVRNFIKYLNINNIQIYIVSSGSVSEIKDVLKKKNLKKYFRLILGNDKNKYENFKIIKSMETNSNGISFGDSKNDWQVSKINNLEFVLVLKDSNWIINDNENRKIKKIKNFKSLKY